MGMEVAVAGMEVGVGRGAAARMPSSSPSSCFSCYAGRQLWNERDMVAWQGMGGVPWRAALIPYFLTCTAPFLPYLRGDPVLP